jgi:hypothetical protein
MAWCVGVSLTGHRLCSIISPVNISAHIEVEYKTLEEEFAQIHACKFCNLKEGTWCF